VGVSGNGLALNALCALVAVIGTAGRRAGRPSGESSREGGRTPILLAERSKRARQRSSAASETASLMWRCAADKTDRDKCDSGREVTSNQNRVDHLRPRREEGAPREISKEVIEVLRLRPGNQDDVSFPRIPADHRGRTRLRALGSRHRGAWAHGANAPLGTRSYLFSRLSGLLGEGTPDLG